MEQKSEFVRYIDAYERWYFTYIEPPVSKKKKTPLEWIKGFFVRRKFPFYPQELKHLPDYKLSMVALGFDIRRAKAKVLESETDESKRRELDAKFNAFHDYVEKTFNI